MFVFFICISFHIVVHSLFSFSPGAGTPRRQSSERFLEGRSLFPERPTDMLGPGGASKRVLRKGTLGALAVRTLRLGHRRWETQVPLPIVVSGELATSADRNLSNHGYKPVQA